jgi:hypothetical protein
MVRLAARARLLRVQHRREERCVDPLARVLRIVVHVALVPLPVGQGFRQLG